MSKSAVITARVSEETLALIDRVAQAQGRSRAWVVNQAINREMEREAAFLDFLFEGVADLDAGRSISHDELVERIKARSARAAA